MKKVNWMPILLIVFAVTATYVACLPNGVAVYDLAQSKEAFYCSYFNLLEDVNFSISLPLAALGACVNLMTASIYVVAKKQKMLSFMQLISMASAVLAVVPILMKDPVIMVVPNVLLPIALFGVCGVAHSLEKKNTPPEAVKLSGKRKK